MREIEDSYGAIYQLMLKKLKEIANGTKLDEFLKYREERSFDKIASKGDNYLFEKLVIVIFAGGFRAKIVDNKKSAIKKAFFEFDIDKVANLNEKQIQEIIQNPNIIRNAKKIRAVIVNAKKVKILQKEYGSFANYIKSFGEDIERLVLSIQDKFEYLGSTTTLDYIKDIGIDVIKPDIHIVRILGRLGLISGTLNSPLTRKEVSEVAKRMSKQLRIKINVIDGVIWLYGADRKGYEVTKTICGLKPLCEECYLQKYCNFYQNLNKKTPVVSVM